LGSLRFILALLVVGSHLQLFGGAVFAVKAFFIVSGFYMALVINMRYHALPVASFYVSRLLRLLPLYWVISLLTLVAEFLLVPSGQYFNKELASPIAYSRGLDLSSLPIPVVIYIVVAVTTMLGLDTGTWLEFNRIGGALSYAPDFGANAVSVQELSPVQPGWSLGLELLFYLIAPFIVRRSIGVILGLCALSLAFRIVLISFGYSGDPWDRSLFPSELVYFLLGVLAYHLYVRLPKLQFSSRTELMLAAMAIGISIIYWPVDWFIRGNLIWNTAPYVLLATGMPFLFKLTKDNSLDANIGELSYPIYMCHALIIGLVLWSPLHDVPFIGSARPLKFVTFFLVIVAAFLLDRLVILPVDKLRVRFGAKKRIEARPILQDLGAISITGTS
jgi:peptidoglycan/LPS O-acetylase OafA/YrhL